MFHVKHVPAELPAQQRERYRQLVHRYHRTLDLMSSAGLAGLDERVDEAERYAGAIEALGAAEGRALDLGSGVGLPGLVIGAALPGLELALVERRRRRAAFLELAAAQLALPNVEVLAEDVRRVAFEPVRVITAQAVAVLWRVYALTAHLHQEEVLLVSRRGEGWRDEVLELEAQTGAAATVELSEALPRSGTLVGLRLPGGMRCRSSA